MNVEGCGKGRFTDDLFEVSELLCTEFISTWVGLIIALIMIKIGIVYQSWRTWIVLYKRQTRPSVKRKYYCNIRLPIIPVFVTTCGILSVVAWILATLDIANLQNGGALILLALFG